MKSLLLLTIPTAVRIILLIVLWTRGVDIVEQNFDAVVAEISGYTISLMLAVWEFVEKKKLLETPVEE